MFRFSSQNGTILQIEFDKSLPNITLVGLPNFIRMYLLSSLNENESLEKNGDIFTKKIVIDSKVKSNSV